MTGFFRSVVIVGLLACACGKLSESPAVAAPSAKGLVASGPVLREETVVQVGNSLEHWALVWRQRPSSACGPEDIHEAITCPCTGFAYGEMGELDLVRKRPGHSEERLALTPLFENAENPASTNPTLEKQLAVLQRWPLLDSDYQAADSADLARMIRARPVTRVMVTHDYVHDGHATEFLLQVGTEPCGKKEAVLVGVSASNSSLHAFTSAAHPERPLVLPMYIWEQLLHSAGSTTNVEWSCGDHGGDTETDVQLWAGPRGIDGVRSEFQCLEGGTRGRLLSSARI